MVNTHTHTLMPRSYTLHCKRGSGKRYHAASGQCRTPCQKSHGKGFRRSPKGPYYKCIKTGSGKKRSSSKKTSTKKSTDRAKKMYSAGKIIAAYRKYSANKKKAASSSSTLPHYAKISSGLKLPIGSKFTTDSGTYKRVSKTENSKGVIKL